MSGFGRNCLGVDEHCIKRQSISIFEAAGVVEHSSGSTDLRISSRTDAVECRRVWKNGLFSVLHSERSKGRERHCYASERRRDNGD